MTSLGLGLGSALAPLAVLGTDSTSATYSDSLAEGIGVLPAPGVIKAVRPIASDVINIAPTQQIYWGLVILERLKLTDLLFPVGKFQLGAADVASISSTLLAGRAAALADAVGIALSQVTQRAITVIENLGLREVIIGAARYNQTFAETFKLTDALLRFFGASMSDAINIAPTQVASARRPGVVSDAINLAQTQANQLVLRVIAADAVKVSPTQALKMLFKPVTAEGIKIAAVYFSPGGGITTWAMNTQTASVTEYSNYNFNSFAKLGRHYVGASSSGIYTLDGSTDAGTSVIARIKSGFAQFSNSKFSSFKAVYLGVRGEGNFILRVVDGEGKSYDYAVATRNTRSTKVHMGKGLRARYFSFELISTGQDFDLDTVEFVPITETRRV